MRVDFDRIAQALGSDTPHDAPDAIKQVAFAARQSAIDTSISKDFEVWVIHTSPTKDQMDAYERAGADFHVMDTDERTCIERAARDHRPARTVGEIHKWFSEHDEQKGKDLTLTKDFKVSLKEGGGTEQGDEPREAHFSGYAATFDRVPDSYGDVIANGAFADTLKEHEDEGRKIPLLFGHRMDDPDYAIGVVDAAEDDKGLKVDGTIYLDTPKGQTVYKMLQRGQVDRMSFAYDVLEDGMVQLEDGTKAHELRKLDLFECSIVTVPANDNAQITEVKESGMHKQKVGRRNSKADEDSIQSAIDALGALKDSISDISDGIDKVTESLGKLIDADPSDDGDTGDGQGSEDDTQAQGEQSEGEDPAKSALDAYKQALISDYTKE